MRPLTAADILRIWEVGEGQDDVERALTILAVATPQSAREQLLDLPLGARDACLLAVREGTFGARMHTVASCPACAEEVEFGLDASELRARQPELPAGAGGELLVAGRRIRYRLPSSADVLAAAAAPDVAAARAVLHDRCVSDAEDGSPLETVDSSWPADVADRVAAAMAAQDPLAEVLVDFVCPACGAPGRTLLDVAAFLWEELRAQAGRLLHQVDALARAYGWREADILAMSAVRRRAYLELAG